MKCALPPYRVVCHDEVSVSIFRDVVKLVLFPSICEFAIEICLDAGLERKRCIPVVWRNLGQYSLRSCKVVRRQKGRGRWSHPPCEKSRPPALCSARMVVPLATRAWIYNSFSHPGFSVFSIHSPATWQARWGEVQAITWDWWTSLRRLEVMCVTSWFPQCNNVTLFKRTPLLFCSSFTLSAFFKVFFRLWRFLELL